VFVIGLYPNAAFQVMHVSADNLIKHVHAKAHVVPAAVQAASALVGN